MENIDKNEASLLAPGVNEDSVDIYDGLDISSSDPTEKSSPSASQLKDSLDLYEEIVTEEQQNKESLFSELKSRFQAAQNQIIELRRRLTQMESQNTVLNTENYRLKKNICALLQTARLEVSRKDAAIQRLTQQSEKGRYHHQPHTKNLRDQNASSSSPAETSRGRTPPFPPSRSAPPPPTSSHPPPLPPQPAAPLKEDCPPRETGQPSIKESHSSTNQLCGSSVETKAPPASSHHHPKGFSTEGRDVPDRHAEHSTRKSGSCSTTRHSESEKHKYKHKENKCSESTDRRHRTGSDPNRNKCHKAERETGRRHDSKSHKNRDYLSEEGHHRSDRTRRNPPELSDRTSSSDKKGKSQDKTKRFTQDSEDGTAHGSKKSQEHKNIKTRDQHNGSSAPSNHHESHSESPKERTGDRTSKYHHRKEDRRHDDGGKKQKRSSPSERCKEHKKQKSDESKPSKVDVCGTESKEKTKDSSKTTSEQPDVTEKKISTAENSPNRKLCFMETLNLTLSPIKKPVLPVSGNQDGVATADKLVENGSDDDLSSQPNIEDMCVIDEVVSCESETGLLDVAERSSGVSQTPGPEEAKKCDEEEQNQGDEKPLQQTPVQMTSVQSSDAAEIQMSVHVPNKSPESESNGDSLKNNEKTKPASDIQAGESERLGATDGVTDTSGSPHEEQTSNSLQNVNLGNITDQSASKTLLDSSPQLIDGTPETSVKSEVPSPSKENPAGKDVPDEAQSQKMLSAVHPQDSRRGRSPPPVSTSIRGRESEAVSSTISLESLPQEGLSLPEAIYILTQTSEDTSDTSGVANEPSSSTGCIAVSKVSSTTECAQSGELTVTPKKSCSPGESPESNSEPSSSVPLSHDEDSMMRTLSNLKRIPDVISPLRSPVRIAKRGHPHLKPGHVKSLEKDFSSTAADATLKTLDVNKENKHPGSPPQNDVQVDVTPDLPSSLSDAELEEGEILSESDETASGSPLPQTKRAKLTRPMKNKASPKTVLKRTSKETHETSGVPTISPKSRFKTVCPAATRASYSTIEEVMETFKLVRAEIRKKYMKLHKTFPKKSFYGVMNNFRESFLEFVSGARFDQISSQQGELKSKLKKLIASVFSKVSNNGIVKRIFEQQAIDLKQKLWDFVDDQVDYLFRDIYTVLKSLHKPPRGRAEGGVSSEKEKTSLQSPAKKSHPQKEAHSILTNPNQPKACPVVPYKTGLGSRGKDIRMTHVEKDKKVDQLPTSCPSSQTVVNVFPPRNVPSSPERSNISSLVVSQNVSLLDKTDFELLTEQQASSLTFNLVTDTQMGEIFKCLLQGSDLLETSAGDNAAWSLGTPRKDGERFISITTPSKFDSPSKMLSPVKFDTPSKLIGNWSRISPRKILLPQSKDQVPLNPALFDESCLLEVPLANRAALQSGSPSQRTYSILAEDLAVSLTIPSPLKSDGHLSFLHPPSMEVVSTPESVISAHISEDALLDEEDATEQDIHLALDTDNSSSVSTVSSEELATPFLFKPDLPMQALVMEKSHDHFIVKICQAAKGEDNTLTAEDSLSQTLTEEKEEDGPTTQSQGLFDKIQDSSASDPSVNNCSTCAGSVRICQASTGSDNRLSEDQSVALTKEECNPTQQNTSNVCLTESLLLDVQKPSDLPEKTLSQNSFHNSPQTSDALFWQTGQAVSREGTTSPEDETTETNHREEGTTPKSPANALLSETGDSPHSAKSSVQNTQESALEKCEVEEDRCCTPTDRRDWGKSGKRKMPQEKSKAKRSRRDEDQSKEETESACKDISEPKTSPTSASNTSLHAKNVIRKKGEVVMAWTRDEDRAILIELKTKGASRETFSVLSEKLNKPSEQVAQRFYQLMKLYKKMDT
ncbi:CASP8-associated protein 2 [Antennarius striatus]|uniref:CASP8-associated protein 2 n=1 Tax=Antennarius striatus TaxID=241820 RepID=UPI0035B3D9CA